MATVRLTRLESETGKLPNVCLRCGAPATAVTRKNFTWQPPWIIVTLFAGLLPYLIIAMILQKRMKLMAPMCEQHRKHWSRQTTFNLVVLGVVCVLVPTLMYRPETFGLTGWQADNIRSAVCMGTGVLILAWLVANVVISSILIHTVEITDRDMQLKGVHEGFQQALARFRVGEGDEEAIEALPEVVPARDPGQLYDPNARKRTPEG